MDGADLFEAAATGIKEAESEIFITDWMLSPEAASPALSCLDL